MSVTIQQTLAKPLKLGVIGGGVNSAVGYAHYVASQLDNKWQMVSGFFSRDRQTNLQTAQAWHIADFKPYETWRDYVSAEKANLDAIVVLTPTPMHAEIVCELLRQNIPVICEKALTASLEDSLTIQQALEETQGFLAVTFNYSGYSMVREMRQRIFDGELGKLSQIQIEMQSDAFINKAATGTPQAWRLKDGPIPMILLDLAVHLHHLVYFVSGQKPQKVLGDFHNFSRYSGIVDDAYLWVDYSESMRAAYWVSKAAYGHKNGLRIRVFGDNGSAEWFQETPDKLLMSNADSVMMHYNRGTAIHQDRIVERFKPGHPTGFIEAFANLYSDIADNLARYQQNPTQFEFDDNVFGWSHAHEGLNLLHKATLSNTQGCWQDI